jgi:hypothetical protein
MTLTNIGGAAKTLDLSATVALADGASATVTVTMRASRGAAGHKQAYLEVREGGADLAHAALFTLVK